MLYWVLKRVLLGPLLRVLFRPRVEGLGHVPRYGPAILASNHLSFSDSIFLPLAVPRRITFPAKMEYFTGRGFKGRLTAAFFRGTGQIPIDRSGGSASQAAVDAGLEVLRHGELFGIYPEGTRSPDGRLYKGKTGVARMALEAKVPVLPVAMIGTDKAQPTGQKIPNIMRIGIRIGRPLDFSRYHGMEGDRLVLRAITDELMYELAKLSGQEYVDDYAANRKSGLAAKAENIVAASMLQTAAAAAKAESLIEAARSEGVARAESIMAASRAQTAAAAARAESIVSASRAQTAAAAAKAESLLEAARVRSKDSRPGASATTAAQEPGFAESDAAGSDAAGSDVAESGDSAAEAGAAVAVMDQPIGGQDLGGAAAPEDSKPGPGQPTTRHRGTA